MSRDALPDIVTIIGARLCELLLKARSIKSQTTIEPSLSGSDFAADARNIAAPEDVATEIDADLASSSSTNQAALETAAREILYEKIGSCEVSDPDFVDVWNLLDLLQICADHKQCDSGLSLWLVEEMVDSQTIDGCRYIMEYLKSRRTQLIGKDLSRNKSNTILRMCNELLRRLSRAEDAVFCGDVFVFLFQVFPLGDKSAVNLRGEFHVENTTTFDPEPEPHAEPDGQQETGDDVMQVDETQKGDDSKQETEAKDTNSQAVPDSEAQATAVPNRSVDDSKDPKKEEKPREEVPDSRTFYPTFWSLQRIFSNPTKSFDPDALAGFKEGLELTFTKFKATPKIPRVAAQSRKRKRNGMETDLASTFNPKYLTSRDLFDLELSDLTFQRHILVQALILLDFLLSLTPEAKKKNEALKTQKSLIYNYTLIEDDSKWCRDMRKTIALYLQDEQDGKLYYRMVDHVLSRDKNWITWKMESCQDISEPPVSFDDYMKAEESVKRQCAPRRVKASTMGALNLDFLNADYATQGLDSLRDPARLERPKPEKLVQEVQNIDLDLEMMDKQTSPEEWAELASKRASKTWRALRLARIKNLSKLAKIDESQNFEKLIEPDEPPQPPPEADPEVKPVTAQANGVVSKDDEMVTETPAEMSASKPDDAAEKDNPPDADGMNGVEAATGDGAPTEALPAATAEAS